MAPRRANPLRVLVADPHPATRAGIRHALTADGFAVCTEAAEAADVVPVASRDRVDLCLLDVRLPGGGIAAAAAMREQLPSVAVVMLAARLDEDELLDALRAGANGYLLKDTDPARLPQILAGALAGEAALPRKLTACLIEELRSHEGRRRLNVGRRTAVVLSAREWQVLEALRDRTPTAQIAARLSVSPVTVRRHISEIVRKLRVPDRDAAVRMFESRREPGRAAGAHGRT